MIVKVLYANDKGLVCVHLWILPNSGKRKSQRSDEDSDSESEERFSGETLLKRLLFPYHQL